MRKKEGGSQPLPEINHDYKAGHKIAPPQTEQGSTPTSSTFSSQKTVMDYVTLERSEEHTSELQSQSNLVCRLLLEKKTTKLRTRSADSNLFGQQALDAKFVDWVIRVDDAHRA